jgi:PhnB protein
MKIQPYLFFQGRCDEALDLYKAVFDAEVALLMRYRESPEPPPMPLPPGWNEKVMHAEFRIGETVLMASDGCGSETPRFEGFSLSVDMPDAETARRAFDALAAGGAVQMPLDKTFFAPCFGMLTDRFGVGWMLIVNE